jgi:hypothetical protein
MWIAEMRNFDVVIAEKLIANGEVEYRAMSLKTIFKRYDLPDGLERSGIVHRWLMSGARQESLIQSAGLETVFDLESKVIWVTAKIEAAGIGIDADGLLQYYDELGDKMDAWLLSWKSRSRLISHRMIGVKSGALNSTYACRWQRSMKSPATDSECRCPGLVCNPD